MFKWPWRKTHAAPRDPIFDDIEQLLKLMQLNQKTSLICTAENPQGWCSECSLRLPNMLLFSSALSLHLYGCFEEMSEELQDLAADVAYAGQDLNVVSFDPTEYPWPLIASVNLGRARIVYGRGDSELQEEVLKLAITAALKHFRSLEGHKESNNARYDELRNSFVRRLGEGLRAEQGE